MKVDRQEIVGVVTALEDWFTMNHEDRILGYESRFDTIVSAVKSIEGVTTRRIEIPHYVPYMLHVVFDPDIVGKTAETGAGRAGRRQSENMGRHRRQER